MNQMIRLLISNVHCPSCVINITSLLKEVELGRQSLKDINVDLLSGYVSFSIYRHPQPIKGDKDKKDKKDKKILEKVKRLLDDNGYHVVTDPSIELGWISRWSDKRDKVRKRRDKEEEEEKRRKHLETCQTCKDEFQKSSSEKSIKGQVNIVLSGLTCSSCVKTLERSLDHPSIFEKIITLEPPLAVVTFDPLILSDKDILRFIKDSGYEGEISNVVDIRDEKGKESISKLILDGMTCSSCVGTIQDILRRTPGVFQATVILEPPLATLSFDPSKVSIENLIEIIEEAGYGAEVFGRQMNEKDEKMGMGNVVEREEIQRRTVRVKIDGMFCGECVRKVEEKLKKLSILYPESKLTWQPFSHTLPEFSLSFIPIFGPLPFNLRIIKGFIQDDSDFKFSIPRSESLSKLSRRLQKRQRQKLLFLISLSGIFAIPMLIFNVIGMSIIPASSSFRSWLEFPIWGSADRGTLASWILATPVQFGIGIYFYEKAWKGVRGVWKRKRWFDRIFRWGSMDTLVAIGTSAGYFASLAYLILDVKRSPIGSEEISEFKGDEGRHGEIEMNMEKGEMGYFDSSVFLMFFILIGRYLESLVKGIAAKELSALDGLTPKTGILIDPSNDDKPLEIDIEYLDQGDVVMIPVGSGPPLDCILHPSSQSSSFDESSLTGEARPVLKIPQIQTDKQMSWKNQTDVQHEHLIFSGTINSGPSPVKGTIIRSIGNCAIDEIQRVVRESIGRKAGVEKVAERVTSIFVPFIVSISIFTWIIWIIRGYLGDLPQEWKGQGGWALFSIKFAVAVLVVACPCGIGLAAPTAQMVAIGLAAKSGILPVRGGEGFEAGTKVNTIVFDKTGTLTLGEFKVIDERILENDSLADKDTLLQIILKLEEASSHPLAKSLVNHIHERFKDSDGIIPPIVLESQEVAGRGLKGTVEDKGQRYEVIIGNEALLSEHQLELHEEDKETINEWKRAGSSVILVGVADKEAIYHPVAFFSLRDPPRPETRQIIQDFLKKNFQVFMITGDNEITATAVAQEIGIPTSNVIANCLPVQKKEQVEKIQSLPSSIRVSSKSFFLFKKSKIQQSKSVVLFVGDGTNDSPAIAQADVGVAMGSGSQMAISTSDFCLLSSNLQLVPLLLELSKKAMRKIMTNFLWAVIYNVILIPLAAGAFYQLGKTRLPPAYAALAMALSSVSVVLNSILMRWTFKPISKVE